MQTQLAEVITEFGAATKRLHRLRKALSASEWNQRVDPARWSVGECVAHLNLTSEGYRPILTDAIARAKRVGGKLPMRLRRDFIGWLLWKTMPPPVRGRTKTIPAFVPNGNGDADGMVRDFEELQEEMIGFVNAADGLPIQNVQIVSPFNSRIKYNLFSCFSILSAHQHRHLWQAEQLWPAKSSHFVENS